MHHRVSKQKQSDVVWQSSFVLSLWIPRPSLGIPLLESLNCFSTVSLTLWCLVYHRETEMLCYCTS